ECLCPLGGGVLGCVALSAPCPELPPPCVETVQGADGCPQCLHLGCLGDGRAYAAGHTVQAPGCRLCHCPASGGELLCYPLLPDCEPALWDTAGATSSAGATGASLSEQQQQQQQQQRRATGNGDGDGDGGDDASKRGDVSPKPVRLRPISTLHYKPSASRSDLPPAPVVLPRRGLRMDSSSRESQCPALDPFTKPPGVGEEGFFCFLPTKDARLLFVSLTKGNRQPATPEERKSPPANKQKPKSSVSRGACAGSAQSRATATTRFQSGSEIGAECPPILTALKKRTAENNYNPPTPPPHPISPIYCDRNSHSQFSSYNSVHFATRGDLCHVVLHRSEECCTSGQRWAAKRQQCSDLPRPANDLEACRMAQKRCCLASLEDASCQAGMTTARQVSGCGSHIDSCSGSMYQKQPCCDCCLLGLKTQSQGLACTDLQGLGQLCSLVYRTCCASGQNNNALYEKGPLRQTCGSNRISERETFNFRDLSVGCRPLCDCIPRCVSLPLLSAVVSPCPGVCLEEISSRSRTNGGMTPTCRPANSNWTSVTVRASTPTPDFHRCFPIIITGSHNTKVKLPISSPRTQADGKTCAHKCVEASTGAQCACHIGYRLRSDAVSCEDVNECLTDEHHCQEGQRCINTAGSFRCQREISCGTGYELTELNHCQGGHSLIKNKNIFFTQFCKRRAKGGSLQPPEGSGADINECTTQLDICQLGYNCINTVGSFTCQRNIINCGRGYHASPDGGRCVDVDECQTGAHQCGDGQQCQNTPGSYRCNCASGYYYDTLGRTCVDINECRQYPGRLCSHTCENVPGSYHCSCSRGFQLGTDGKTCEDTNECESSPCSQECANVIGSYQCYCRRGFQPSEVDGVTCEDVDECSLPGSNGGLCAYRCANVPGSFECYCPAYGYTMSPNGRSCLDCGPRGTGTHNCSSSENCFNMQGGFRCLSYHCPSNYRRSAENRCERMSCADPQDCASSPVRITYYQLSFPRTVPLPANIFRIGPSPAYAGDTITLGLTAGNHEGLFATRKMNAYTGVVYMQRAPDSPRDLLLNVEMRLFRQGTFTTFLAKIYAFITSEDF
uniref:Fibulin-1 n=1 Tax=Petromyzon marinus TaxID=7757 RepID=S4R548_PETMA